MNESNTVETELSHLGEVLRGEPSVAASVVARLQAMGSTQVVELPSTKRKRTFAGIAMSLATVAAVIALMFVFRADGVAFAQIQKRIAAFQTASLRYQQSVFKQDENETEISKAEMRVSMNTDGGRTRVEMPDGSLDITNKSNGKRLFTDNKNQTATLAYVYDNREEYNLLAMLQSMHLAANAQNIAARNFDGETCEGFRIDEPESVLRVWVSPKTMLPVHAERTIENVDGVEPSGKVRVVTTFTDIRFGVPLADDLFSLNPPTNYVLTEIGKPPASISEVFPTTPQIKPLEGVGPLKFGMTQLEAMQLLGRPDQEDISKPQFNFDENTSQVDDKPRPTKDSRLVILTEFHALTYFSLGLRLNFEVHEGLVGFSFNKNVQIAEGVEFPGMLANGIRIGSSEQDVIKAFGEHSKGYSNSMFYYKDQGLMFVMSDQHIVSTLQMDLGSERRLRFEWREPDEKGATDGK